MDDRQRQFAQFATALNQYAGSGDRGSRDRTAPDGRSSTGSTSSGSSNGSGNAATALWSELGRAGFPFNYSGWPQPHQGTGSEYHRYGSYGGFNENTSENRNVMENRPEGRRVPSKGETKATPPLPPGLSAGIGSTLASLQQLVGLPNEDVYRTILAQQYAAAAALSGLPPSTHPQMSPIPPASHSTLSPSQIHGAVNASSARHHQQQLDKHHQQQFDKHHQQQLDKHHQQQLDKHHQQQLDKHHQQQLDKHLQQQYHLQQRSRHQQQSKSPSPAIPLLTTMSGPGHSSSGTSESNLNGEYMEQVGRGAPSQLSPLTSRKERLLEHTLESFPSMRQVHNPTPPKSTSISPIDRLTPSQITDRQQHHFNAYEDEGKLQEMNIRGADIGARSGSESEGDQRARHKRKQDQPRRQSVIYSNAVHPHQIGGNGQHEIPAASADSSSEDSQGYDSLLNHPPTNDPVKESIRNNSPLVSISNDPIGSAPSTISQAMSHVLSHPFVAAHLNTPSLNSYIEQKHPKKESASSQYRNDFGVSSPHLAGYKNDLDASSYVKEKCSPQYRADCKVNSLYSTKDSKISQSYYRNEKDVYDAVDYRDRQYSHQSPSNPNVHPYHFESKNNRSSPASHYEAKLANFHTDDQLSSHFVRDDRLYNSQYRNTSNEIYYAGSEENNDLSNYRYSNKPPPSRLTIKEQKSDDINSQFLPNDNANCIRPKHCEMEINSELITESVLPKDRELKCDQVNYSKEKQEDIQAASSVKTSDIANVKQPPQNLDPQLNELPYNDKEERINDSNVNCISNDKNDNIKLLEDKQKAEQKSSQPLEQVKELPDKEGNKADFLPEKVKLDATSTYNEEAEKAPEVSEPLINGDTCENDVDDHVKLATADVKNDCQKISDCNIKSTDLLNGDHDPIISPTKKTKKKLDTFPMSPECNENKRSTRQKRPVSYVEDETDPVLEMNEDTIPLLSPAKKRGRKCKDKNDSGHDDSMSSPPLPCDSKSINQENLSPSYYDEIDQNKHSRERELECAQIPHNISVPLHIDTSVANNYSKIDGGMPCPPSVTPVVLSPDIYDFNDIDGEGRGRCSKKRGRKRGSPKKVGRATPEYLRTNLSPRMRDTGVLCNKSPKFFTSNRVPDGLERISICNDNGSKPSYLDFSGKPLNNDSFIKNSMTSSNPLIPLPLMPNSSSIVDEVEMQLAALHKEHIAEAENRKTNTPERISLKVEVHQSDTASDVKVKDMVVQKPMLSVVPLDQLTYEGMRKKNLAKAKSEAFLKSNELTLERICKDPLNSFLGSECMPSSESDLNMISSNRDLDNHNAAIKKESSSIDRVASPSSSASSITAVEEKSELDLSENIHIYNENFDSEGERNVIYTKMISRENCENIRNKGIFPSDSPSSHGSTPKNVPEDVFKDKGAHLNAVIDSHLLDNAANITFNQPNIQLVSVAEIPSSVGMSGRHVRGGRQRRRGGRRRSNVSESCNVEEPALHDTSVAVPSTESNNADNLNEPFSANDRLRRRSRRSNLDLSPTSLPPLGSNALTNNTSDDIVPTNSNLFERVPLHYPHVENHEMDFKIQQNNVQREIESNKPNCTQANHNEAETLEDIAKFLEDTAPSLEPKSPSKLSVPSGSSCSKSDAKHRNNCETSYKDARPKRKSRPPPEMNDKEVNDLFLLLNMEDEESEDEDYVPKDAAELDAALDSDDHESYGEDSEEFSDVDGDSDMSGDEAFAKKRSHPGVNVDKESQNCHPVVKKRKDESHKNKKGSSTKMKLIKGKSDTSKKKDETKRKWEDKYDGRGPLLRFSKSERTELIINAPDRNFEQDKNKQFSIPFHVDAKMGKVGFSSTLHNSYDAFNKDLSWFCAFCKNFSHYRTLGDLFGPFFIRGLNFCKKTYPEVVEGQVSEVALSPHPCFPFDGVSSSSKPRNKKTPKHESIEQTGDVKKNEVGSISPPVRFVPSATPARMLVGRGNMTPRDSAGLSSPRIPLNSPNSSSAGTSQSASVAMKSEPGSTSQQNSGQEGTECWLHEECILWSSGVTVVNSKLCGLDEAVIAAQDSVCSHCGETGATVCCLGKGCSNIVHVPCARFLMWSFSTVTFQSFCPKHSVSKGCTNPKGKSSRKS